MFEFTGRLKTLSFVLILIGVVSVGLSFFTGGGNHHEGEAHGEATTEHAEGAAEHGHEAHGAHGDEHSIPDANELGYHKTASRAIPSKNHKYQGEAHHDAEHAHHQAENKPWANLLVNNFFFLAIALGALFFLAIQYAAQAGWTVVVLRVLEAMTQFIWLPMLILIIMALAGINHVGGNHLWHWMAEGIMDPTSSNYDALIAGKEGYLNGPFFIIRLLIYFVGWAGAAFMLRKMSRNMDVSGLDHARNWVKMRNLSAAFLVFFAVTSSTSAWDIIMSIDTHWFSTLFGWYVFSGMFVSALTVLMLLVLYLKSKGHLEQVNGSHIQDMAKFMFAFSIFWTYLWFSQYMLIWYSNIPEEVTYYMIRFREYKVLFMIMLAMNFLFPVLVLMSRDTKRNYGFIITAGIVMIIGHWLDVYIMIYPGSVGVDWSLTLVNLGTFLGYVGLFIFVVFRAISRAPLMPENHPMYVESKYHHI
jgi:hypothetical protein